MQGKRMGTPVVKDQIKIKFRPSFNSPGCFTHTSYGLRHLFLVNLGAVLFLHCMVDLRGATKYNVR
jgi:hypothetical protein